MTYTPVELRHVKLKRGLLGYRRSQLDRLLADDTASFETVWRERADHADRIDQLDGELTRYRELEGLLRATLVSVERAAYELKDQAKREADTIINEAHAEARTITRRARAEREALSSEVRRMRVLLQAALGAIDEAGASDDDEKPTQGKAA
jgi:cell division initiation protein